MSNHKDDRTGGEEEKGSLDLSNNDQVIKNTAKIHSESSEDVCGSINTRAVSEGNSTSQRGSIAGSDLSSRTSHVNRTNPDPKRGIVREKSSFNVWDNLHPPKSEEKKVKLSGTTAKTGQAANHYAANEGHVETSQFLVKNGAKLDLPDKTGQAANHYAANEGHVETSQFLVKNGAKLDLPDKTGQAANHYAANEGHVETSQFLVKNGAKLDLPDKTGQAANHYAANEGHVETSQFLVKNGAKLDLPDKTGQAANHYAANEGHVETSQFLVKNGAKLDLPDKTGQAANHYAANEGHVETSQFLVKNGAKLDLPDKSVPYCLSLKANHYAANEGHVETSQFLVKNGAKLDLPDKTGQAANHYAANEGHVETSQFLVKNGAKLDLPDKTGQAANHYAANEGHVKTSQFLVKNGAKLDLPDKFIKAARTCDLRSMKKFMEEHEDLDLDCTDETGQAAIHYAANEGHVETLQFLVKNGANMDLPDKQKGKTALHHAVNIDRVKAVEYLVYAGAGMTVRDREGKMPEQFSQNETMRMTLSNMRAAIRAESEVPEIRMETNEVHEGSMKSFKNLGLVVEYSNNGKRDSFIMTCRQNTTENSDIDFGFQEKEEVVSDVFVYRISCNKGSLQSTVTVPLFCAPEQKKEVVIKTNNGNEFVATDVKEKMKKWTCKFNADLQKYKAFVAVCRPMKETFEVGTEATTVHSAVDERVEISIPENAFEEPTKVTIEITEPPETIEKNTEDFKDIMSATSFYSIVTDGGKPTKSIHFKVPLPTNYNRNGSIVILSMDKDETEENENSWSILDFDAKVVVDRVVFNVASFSVKVGVESLYLKKAGNEHVLKRQVSQLYRKSRRREHSVIFLMLMKRIGETNMWIVAVECCHEDKAAERQKHWENEHYEKQEEKSKDQIVALSKQKYRVKLNDAIQVVGTSDDVKLEFHPKRYNFQQFLIEINEEKPFVNGKLDIIQLSLRPGTAEEDEKSNVEKLLKSFEFKLDWIETRVIFSSTSDFLNDNYMKELMSQLKDDWFPVMILMGISFSEIEKVLNTPGNLRDTLITLALNWRDKNKGQEHLGVPVIVSAAAKSGAFAFTTMLRADLKKWRDKQTDHEDVFYKWLKKAYMDNNLLSPGDYPCPMSDSYLAIISTHLEPSFETALSLQLTKEEHEEVLADKAYRNDRLKVMKLLVIFRAKSPSLIKGLDNLIQALVTLKKSRPKKWAIMCASNWVKRTAVPMDPFRTQVDELMQKVN